MQADGFDFGKKLPARARRDTVSYGRYERTVSHSSFFSILVAVLIFKKRLLMGEIVSVFREPVQIRCCAMD